MRHRIFLIGLAATAMSSFSAAAQNQTEVQPSDAVTITAETQTKRIEGLAIKELIDKNKKKNELEE